MPIQVFTEENLVKVLTDETEKVNLENHYWLSNNTLSKIGALAPNLTTLSVRRMPQISNIAFSEIFCQLTKLVTADFSDCT